MSVLLPWEAGDKPGQGQQGLIAPTSHKVKAGVVSWFRKMRQMATTNPEGRPGAKDQNQRCEVGAETYRQQGKESACPEYRRLRMRVRLARCPEEAGEDAVGTSYNTQPLASHSGVTWEILGLWLSAPLCAL